ncbi:unnamed protein product, partial [Adineta steineri]
ITTASMTDVREEHTASVLSNGNVLVTGGGGNGFLNSVELYDLPTATWTTIASMNNPRRWHTSSVLTDGKVLVVGGSNVSPLSSVELY